jgi:hypothetical protein
MIIISVCQVSQCREVLVGWLVVSFTLTFHLQRYTGYHNYRYLCMSIYRVPFHADELRASSGPVVAYLPCFPVMAALCPQTPAPRQGCYIDGSHSVCLSL